MPILEQTERTCGAAPAEMHLDAGYGSGENILRAKEHGTALQAPIGSKASESSVTLGDFDFDEAGDHVVCCPKGELPVEHQAHHAGRVKLAIFTPEQCQNCPFRGQCPTETRGDKRVLPFAAADVAVARRRAEQATPEFKERHKIRSGIEATNSELKRCHGLAKPRVRRQPQLTLSVRLKVMALNTKRYVKHLVVAAVVAPEAACAC